MIQSDHKKYSNTFKVILWWNVVKSVTLAKKGQLLFSPEKECVSVVFHIYYLQMDGLTGLRGVNQCKCKLEI